MSADGPYEITKPDGGGPGPSSEVVLTDAETAATAPDGTTRLSTSDPHAGSAADRHRDSARRIGGIYHASVETRCSCRALLVSAGSAAVAQWEV